MLYVAENAPHQKQISRKYFLKEARFKIRKFVCASIVHLPMTAPSTIKFQMMVYYRHSTVLSTQNSKKVELSEFGPTRIFTNLS